MKGLHSPRGLRPELAASLTQSWRWQAVIPADVVALMSLNLRAVGEYATYCGFDVSSQEERLFALNVLAYASSPTDASKQIALAKIVRIARDVALRKAWKDLEKHAA